MNRWYAVFVVVLIAGSGWLWWTQPPLAAQPAAGEDPVIGRVAPDFTLTTLTGETVRLHELRGQPVVLNFWATWCAPCRRELPALQAAAERYSERVIILGIDQGETPEVVQPYVDEMGLTFAIPMDTDFEVAGLYNVRGLPTTYFVDSEGVIRHLWLGEMNSITLAEGIAQIWR